MDHDGPARPIAGPGRRRGESSPCWQPFRGRSRRPTGSGISWIMPDTGVSPGPDRGTPFIPAPGPATSFSPRCWPAGRRIP